MIEPTKNNADIAPPMTPASGRLATDCYEPAPQIGPGQRKSSIRTTGAHASGCRLFARLSAVSHCSRLAVLFDASAKTVPATLNLPCSGQSNPSASPVLSRAAASDRQIGHVVIGQPSSRRVVNGTATCASKRIASVAQLVRRAPDRCHPWPITPRRCAPSCWRAPSPRP
jgi:hypothetical protein